MAYFPTSIINLFYFLKRRLYTFLNLFEMKNESKRKNEIAICRAFGLVTGHVFT